MRKPTRRQSRLLDELREHVRNAVPFELTFSPTPGMKDADVKYLQEHLKHHFQRWAETWVLPWINMLEASLYSPPLTKKE